MIQGSRYNLRETMYYHPKLHILVSRQEIVAIVDQLAAELTRDYRDKRPLLVGILKGSFMFIADLIRQLDFPLEVEFVRLSSYGARTQSSGKIEVMQALSTDIRGREVLVVEDIVDTGFTVAYFLDYLQRQGSASVRLCALSDKPARRQVPVSIDYLGITLPDKFMVGYGLDLNEEFRNLPYIAYIED